MKYTATILEGVWIIDLELKEDERGFFARSWCSDEFAQRGLNPHMAQCSLSCSTRKGTLRGMHFQTAPGTEAKLVRCSRGIIHDVVLDLRKDSKTFKKWISVDLGEENHRMVYIPEGCAHGFQTLADHSEVVYQISTAHEPALSAGVRWNDPSFGINWPLAVTSMSDKDKGYVDFK